MKKGMILAAAMVLGMCGMARAGTGDTMGDLGVTVDLTWVSKYIWNGFDKLDDRAAFQPAVYLDLFDTGFSVGIWGSWAGSGGPRPANGQLSPVQSTELDYIISWDHSFNFGERYQTDIGLSWIYYDYTRISSDKADAQEIAATIAMPQLIGCGLVPRYTAQYLWPSKSDGPSNGIVGWIHRFGVDYNLVVGEIIPNNPEQVFTFGWDITYNDGAGAVNTSNNPASGLRPDVDSDWSHMTWSLITEIGCPWGGTFRPGLYYQNSMDDSVNDEDELWTGLSYTIEF